jgi:hypothetical protein
MRKQKKNPNPNLLLSKHLHRIPAFRGRYPSHAIPPSAQVVHHGGLLVEAGVGIRKTHVGFCSASRLL